MIQDRVGTTRNHMLAVLTKSNNYQSRPIQATFFFNLSQDDNSYILLFYNVGTCFICNHNGLGQDSPCRF